MTLLAIQTYFLRVKISTFSQLAKEFQIDKEVLQDMLSFWIKKGKLKRITNETEEGCNTRCSSCKLGCFSLKKNLPQTPIYEWVG